MSRFNNKFFCFSIKWRHGKLFTALNANMTTTGRMLTFMTHCVCTSLQTNIFYLYFLMIGVSTRVPRMLVWREVYIGSHVLQHRNTLVLRTYVCFYMQRYRLLGALNICRHARNDMYVCMYECGTIYDIATAYRTHIHAYVHIYCILFGRRQFIPI